MSAVVTMNSPVLVLLPILECIIVEGSSFGCWKSASFTGLNIKHCRILLSLTRKMHRRFEPIEVHFRSDTQIDNPILKKKI